MNINEKLQEINKKMNKEKTFAEKLKELREKKKLSQYEVATKLDIKRERYNTWEQGSALPRMDLLPRICSFYNVSADYLLGINEQQNRIEELETALKEIQEFSDIETAVREISKNAIESGVKEGS